MNIPFDKVYVISYVKNIDKQNNIKNYLNNVWNIDFQFIYGIDANALKNIFNFNFISFIGNNNINYDIGHISCSIGHYTAIEHAYISGYNSCLIIEDDTIFTNDLDFIQNCFNYIPDDADTCRFAINGLTPNEEAIYKFNLSPVRPHYPLYKETEKNDWWEKNKFFVGAQCYSINNRETMLQYINEMNKYFREADDNYLFHDKNVYVLVRAIGKDPESQIKIND